MTIQSKLTPVMATCHRYVHPWTNSCSIATAGLILQATQDSFRIYSAFYTLSLLMRWRIPSVKDLKHTVHSIIQSTAFLTTSACAYCLILCIIARTIGSYNFFTFSYIPAFMSSVCALLIERPSRRSLLSLYVTNVATEALFRMAVARGMIRTIHNGQVLVFGLSATIILYYLRLGLSQHNKDSIFDLLHFIIGDQNQQEVDNNLLKKRELTVANAIDLKTKNFDRMPLTSQNKISSMPGPSNRFGYILRLIHYCLKFINQMKHFVHLQHSSCIHRNGCLTHIVHGGTKLFSVGVGLQIMLKIILNAKKIIKNGPMNAIKIICNTDTLKLAIFLGGFSSIYRMVTCVLTHLFGYDHSAYAIPAGLMASISYLSYPDISVSLYVMWKMLQIIYNYGVDRGWVPKLPNFNFFLYCASTAMLFHAATLEPLCLRPSYWKFLHSLSGGRIAAMDRTVLDIYGLDTVKQLAEVLKRTKTNQIITYTL